MRKIACIVWISIIWLCPGKAQEIPKVQPGVYVNGDGRLFIQKQLPVYLWISTSPDENAPGYLLTSDSSKSYSNPMYFDTEGRNTIRSPWAVDKSSKELVYPLQDIVYEVYADGKPPVTRIVFSEKSIFSREGISYYRDLIHFSLNATDEISGVSASYISLNGKPFEAYSKEIALTEEATYSVSYYSTDHVGNSENVKERKVALDKTAPVTAFAFEGFTNEAFVSSKASVVLNSTDAGSGIKAIYYRINAGPEYLYQAPVPVTRLADGKSTLSFYAVDNVGNRENVKTIGSAAAGSIPGKDPKAEKLLFEFYIDKDPPTVELTLEGDQHTGIYPYISPRTRISLVGRDDKSGVEKIQYSLNTAELNSVYTEPFTLAAEGLQYLHFSAADFVGNTALPKISKFYNDGTPPVSSISIKGLSFAKRDTLYVGKDALFSLRATDGESGLKELMVSTDNLEMGNYSKPFNVAEEGSHIIRYYAIDNVNNKEEIRYREFHADLTPPEIHHHFSVSPIGTKTVRDEEYTIYPTHTQIYFAATDKDAGGELIQYAINGTPLKTDIPVKDLLPGNYIIKIIAYDVLKNKSEKEIRFAIEK
jgi:hypothetical protein